MLTLTLTLPNLCGKAEPDPCCHTQHLRSLRSQKTMSSRPIQFASRTGVGTTGLFLSTNALNPSAGAASSNGLWDTCAIAGAADAKSDSSMGGPLAGPPLVIGHFNVEMSFLAGLGT